MSMHFLLQDSGRSLTILDREHSLRREEGLPTSHQETKYALLTQRKFPSVEIDVPVNQISHVVI